MTTATYSPEDNKLRIYTSGRLPDEDVARMKAAGFRWAPKQALWVAPMWTPAREDLARELAGEIDDEDTSLIERAEERSERFEQYSENRAADAESAAARVQEIAGGIPMGQPILVGHHSERHARRDAAKIENGMRKAVNAWKTSKYWTDRAAGAVRHAKYKELPSVRARRIKGLEADLRKCEKNAAEAARSAARWLKVDSVESARTLANYEYVYMQAYPNTHGSHWTAYDVLKPDGERYRECPAATLQEVTEQAAKQSAACIAANARWIEHYTNRLAYERAMLGESGGTVADRTKPEKGGAVRCWCSKGYGKGWSIVHKVNKVSVTVSDSFETAARAEKVFSRTIPFDGLRAIMTAAEVSQARAEGRLLQEDARGFFLGCKDTDEAPAVAIAPTAPKADPTIFEAMQSTLKAGGVQTISAPQLFPTPPDIAAQVVDMAGIEAHHRVLEPSAGTGALLSQIEHAADIVAVEINQQLADRLRGPRPFGLSIRCADFLACNGDLGTFDRIVMNPPFENGADIKHIQHARGMLREGGRLVAICANGPRQRDQLMPEADEWIELDAGTFAGTNVRAAIGVFSK